jgi:hypothetical protein
MGFHGFDYRDFFCTVLWRAKDSADGVQDAVEQQEKRSDPQK